MFEQVYPDNCSNLYIKYNIFINIILLVMFYRNSPVVPNIIFSLKCLEN